MKISTQITTQIVLNQAELTEAIIDYIKARTELPADSKFAVDFEDDTTTTPADLTAVVNITGSTGATVAPVTTKATRKVSAKAAPAAAPAEVETAPETTPNISAQPEDRKDPAVEAANDEVSPPFDTEVAVPNFNGAAPEAAVKIFPETGTSAPSLATQSEEPPKPVKSLFANLTKPAA